MSPMNTFFGISIQPGTLSGMTMVLILSVLIGGIVGFEREIHGHPAGLRTHIMVCLGSTLMTLVSANMGHGSNDRISAQIVSGVGFLGAGAIIRDGATVRGLTTAASIWASAGMGIALGTSPFFGQLAVIASFVIIFTLWGLTRLEAKLDEISGRPVPIQAILKDDEMSAAAFLGHISNSGLMILSIHCDPGLDKQTRHFDLRVSPTEMFDREKFLRTVISTPGVLSVSMPSLSGVTHN